MKIERDWMMYTGATYAPQLSYMLISIIKKKMNGHRQPQNMQDRGDLEPTREFCSMLSRIQMGV